MAVPGELKATRGILEIPTDFLLEDAVECARGKYSKGDNLNATEATAVAAAAAAMGE